MPRAIVVGGGLAGLATAAALGDAGISVDLYEARPFLGGRATSYPAPGEDAETIDNCQHVLIRCCVNLLDFYGRLRVTERIRFFGEFFFLEPGGRISTLKAGPWPAPFHFSGAFLRMPCLTFGEKLALGRGMAALWWERTRRQDLDRISMADWLREKRQPARVVERFWRQVLVSAINEELDRMAASHGFQVLWLGFLARADSYEMGIPAVPLGDLYGADSWSRWPHVRLHLRTPVERVCVRDGMVSGVVVKGELAQADQYVLSLPFERVGALVPELALSLEPFEHSPITGIHLWFDRPVTSLPHGTLLDRTIHWFFNKDAGKYIQVVVSASRSLLTLPRNEVIALTVRELGEFLPGVREAQLVKAHVVKEARATFSACPGLEDLRPGSVTPLRNLVIAGDWTRSGWPATMEGAVRSGYLAAEAVCAALGEPRRFLLPDVA